MKAVEDKLRASLRQTAEEIPAHSVPPLDLGYSTPVTGPRHGPARDRRWPGWVAPAAAAASVAAVIAASLAFSALTGHRHAAPGRDAAAAATLAKAPPYFVSLVGGHAAGGTRAVVHATATGALLGSVRVPAPCTLFRWVAGAGDDRTFVLGALSPTHPPSDVGTTRFYRLTLSRSGRPGTLAPLPVPPQSVTIHGWPATANGFALSPDGSRLAMSFIPVLPHPIPSAHPLLKVFSLASGAVRTWVWSGSGYIGQSKPAANSLAWEPDSRTLLFETQTWPAPGKVVAQARSLDTSAPAGGLAAASKPLPMPGSALSGGLFITGDGDLIGSTYTATPHGGPVTARQRARALLLRKRFSRIYMTWVHDTKRHAPAKVTKQAWHRSRQALSAYQATQPTYTFVGTVTEFSAKTGKPVAVLYRQVMRQQATSGSAPAVAWVNPAGTTMIIATSGAAVSDGVPVTAAGVLSGGTFTPLPTPIQREATIWESAW
jgi:hypothetical protein